MIAAAAALKVSSASRYIWLRPYVAPNLYCANYTPLQRMVLSPYEKRASGGGSGIKIRWCYRDECKYYNRRGTSAPTDFAWIKTPWLRAKRSCTDYMQCRSGERSCLTILIRNIEAIQAIPRSLEYSNTVLKIEHGDAISQNCRLSANNSM